MRYILKILLIVLFCGVDGKKPNILFIMGDDIGYNDVGYSKYTDMTSPVLDGLAKEGLRLTYSYTHSTCSPSRAALLSGLYSFRYGLQKNAIIESNNTGLDLSLTVLPQALKQLGYRTHIIGKWHLGFCKKAYTPNHRGFDTFHGFLSGAENYYTHYARHLYDYYKNDKIVYSDAYATDDFANTTIEIIKNKGKQPFYIHFAPQSIHTPLQQTPDCFECEDSKRSRARDIMRNFDANVGRIIKALKDTDQLDNTIVIFTSDNGGKPSGGASNYPLRGCKHTLWEGGTRIRSFLYGKQIPRGRYSGLFHVVDWYPTIVSMAGGTHQLPNMDGVDQWKYLKRNEDRFHLQPRKSFIYNVDDWDGKSMNAAVRYRKLDETGTFHDYKLLLGDPGDYSGIYPLGTEEVFSKQYFNPGLLYNMNVTDDKLERKQIVNDAIREEMMGVIKTELEKGYQAALETYSDKYIEMKDDAGRSIIGPGWC